VERFTNSAGTVTDVVLERDDGATVLVGHPHDAYEGPRKHAEHCADAARWLDRPVIVDGLVVYVDDLEAHHAAAVAAGARVISGLETNPLQRQYRVEDLEGHRWMFATRVGR
jgi:PhnB protein